MPLPEQNFHEVGGLASTKFSFGNAQIQLGTTTCNRAKRAIAPELTFTLKIKSKVYLFTPQLAHPSDRVRELELSYQVSLGVSSKSWKKYSK